MAKKVASVKQTGGGGFSFENKVAAYFLSCMLRDKAPLDPELGTITRIDFQVRVDGWFLDDIILTLNLNGKTHICSFSVKSNQQFLSNSAPKEFVSIVWEQFLHEGTQKFDRENDLLGLITTPLNQTLSVKLNSLMQKARTQDSAGLPTRLKVPGYATDIERDLFKSFACPEKLASTRGVTEAEIGELLRHIKFLEFDFERENSTYNTEAIENCRDSLTSNSLDEALFLWETLQVIANEYRIGGNLDLAQLVKKLKFRYGLKNYPDYDTDWKSLIAHTQNNLLSIPHKIGNKVIIDRGEEIRQIEEAFSSNVAIVILAPSGYGKTVIAKLFGEKKLDCDEKAIWVNASNFEREDISTFEMKLKLRHSLKEILLSITDQHIYIIIDGIDQIFSEYAFQNLCLILNQIGLSSTESPYKILITCQPEDWNRVQTKLVHFNVPLIEWNIINLEISDEKLNTVFETFPELKRLKLKPYLRPLLLKPKILDILATNLSVGKSIDISKWVGESDLIEWFWELEIRKQPKATIRDRFVQFLAEKQADNLEFGIPITEFSIDLDPVDSLKREQILEEKEGCLYFYHDIYGDWARQKILKSKERKLSEYLDSRINSPLWLRALRLYGMHLLEKKDLPKWHSAFDNFGTYDVYTIQKDVLLESAIFTADPLQALELLWSDLIATEGSLLRRFLGRFLHTATIPNPRILKIAKEQGLNVGKASTIMRIPYWPYWVPILKLLHNHSSDVIKYAPKEIGEIANIWLRLGQNDYPLRKETAKLALDNATAAFNLQDKDCFPIIDEDVEKIAYTAALAAIKEIPERVETFALAACSRNTITKQRLEYEIYKNENDEKAGPLPWPDGPNKNVNLAFQEICLQTNALYPVIENNPSLAREVILALLIKEPQISDPDFEYYMHKELSIEYMDSWYPYLYHRGPFLFFLNNQPKEGLELILKLVNFATERWDEERKKKGDSSSRVEIYLQDGSRKLIGNYDVYFWYRDNTRCSGPVVVALMALEKWIYDMIEVKDKSIKEILVNLLNNLESVALVGVLNAVGCRYPFLFIEGTIKPLITAPEFHNWEFRYGIEYGNLWRISWDHITSLMDKYSTEMAIKWHTSPHRYHGIHEISQLLFLNVPHMRTFFENTRSKWIERFEEMDDENEIKGFLENLIARYNIQNYSTKRDKGNKEVWMYDEPEEQVKKIENSIKVENSLFLLNIPITCSKIIKDGDILSEEKLESFWQDLQLTSNFTLPIGMKEFESKEDIICGLIAVLFENNCWLEKYPDRKEWCIRKIFNILSSPPKPVIYDNSVNILDFNWDHFCARVIPKLWAQNPESQELRRHIATLAMHYHYNTVEILFKEASKFRKILGDHFKQLQHFIRLWSVAKIRLKLDSNFDINIWIEEHLKSFINGSMTKEIPKWDEIEYKVPFNNIKYEEGRKRRTRSYPGIDLYTIKSAYNWLPLLDQADSKKERLEWINFWEETLQYTLRLLRNNIEDQEKIKGTPSDWDKWVIAHVSNLVLDLKSLECPRNFWEPILNLGVTGRYWVENFFFYWFYYGIQRKDKSNVFLTEWNSMIEYAFSSPVWDPEKNRGSEEIWCSLIGINYTIRDFWNSEQVYIIKQMHSQYKRWAKINLNRIHCYSEFVSFLQMHGAADIVLDGLVWLNESTTDRLWNNKEIQKKLPHLLEMTWISYQSRIRQKKEYFDSFKNLLRGLAETQNPYAMELQDRISIG